jgi:xanthine dehydrogenase accessory factor
LEIFLEPQIPAPRLLVAGDTPIAGALSEIARAAGYEVVRADAADLHPDPSDAAAIVASHGEAEEAVLVRALHAGVPYVALVASERRGMAVLTSLDVPEALRDQVHTPAGLDIGARTPADIAIAILAQIVATRTAHAPAAAEPATAVDPVCGMTVAATDATVHLDTESGRVHFCCEGCRATYAAAAR